MIDTKSFNADLDSEEVASLAGIPLQKKGKYTWIICPFHDDRHFGSAFLTPYGCTCKACGKNADKISMYMQATGKSFLNTINDLSVLVGDVSSYSIDTTQFQTDNHHYLVTPEDKKLLGLANPSYLKRYYPVNFFSLKPKEKSFKNVIYRGDEVIEEYIISNAEAEKGNMLNELFRNDYPAYCWLIFTKGIEQIDKIDELLRIFIGNDSLSGTFRTVLKTRRRKLYKIIERCIEDESTA